MKQYSTFGRIVRYFTLCFAASLIVLPIVWMFVSALKSESEIFSPHFWPREFNLENFWIGWTREPFTLFVANSLIVAGVSTLLVIATSALAGYAFAVYRFRGRTILLFVVLGTLMIPPQVTMIPTFLLMAWLRLLDSYAGLVLPTMASGFGIFLMRQFFLTLPRDLIQAGRIDGAGELRIFSTIMLPLARPAWATLGAFAFLASWNGFLWPLVILDSESKFTLPIGLLRFTQQYNQEFHLMMAVSAISLLPSLVIFLICQRAFVEGIATSGLKG